MIACVGDSLTFGSVGYSYLTFISQKEKYVNLGVNGDTVCGGYRRVLRYLKSKKYKEADTWILALGTNDVLFPYLRERSLFWRMRFWQRNKRLHFAPDSKIFAACYERMVRVLLEQGKRVILVGLPYIELVDYPLDKLEKYNDCIRSISEKYRLLYIDILKIEKRYICPEQVYNWGSFNWRRIWDGIYMLVFFRRKDSLSRIRKLTLTVDGVHFNSRTAKILAKKLQLGT